MSKFKDYLDLFGTDVLSMFMQKATNEGCLTESEQERCSRTIVEYFSKNNLQLLGQQVTEREIDEYLDMAREFIDRNTLRNENNDPSGSWFTETVDLPSLSSLREKLSEDFPIVEAEETPFPLLNDYLELVRRTQGLSSMEQVKRSSLEFASIMYWLFHLSKSKKNLKSLLLGNVQIGKTTRLNAIIQCAPYFNVDLIVMLAGNTRKNRNQNQLRIEEDVIGYDPLKKIQKYDISYITEKRMRETALKEGIVTRDVFDMVTKRDQGKQSGDALTLYGVNRQSGQKSLHILVVKKDKTVLEGLHNWLINQGFTDSSRIIILDDESDLASNDRPSKKVKHREIASQIKKLLSDFPNHFYLGVTATAAAVFFGNNIDECVSLYPEYLQIIDEPPGYLSPYKIFKIDEPEPEYRAIAEGYEKYKFIVENDQIDESHRELTFQSSEGPMEPSLIQSIHYFFMTGGLLRLRGAEKEHHSMMVHIKLRKEYHTTLKIQIDEYIKSIGPILLGEKKDSLFWASIIGLYRTEVMGKKEHNLNVYKNDLTEKGIKPWEVAKKIGVMQKPIDEREIPEAVSDFYKDMLGTDKSCTYIINSENNQTFSYEPYKEEGFKGILIGALTIGRALTLKGLRVSYYNREIHAGDTATQNMRWTGYHSHHDLIRIFLRDKITRKFQAAVCYQFNLEMKLRQTDRTAVREFLLWLNQHSQTDVVPTNKRGGASIVKPSEFTKIQNVATFEWKKDVIQKQKEAVESLVKSLKKGERQGIWGKMEGSKDYVYRGVDKELLFGFLESYPNTKYARFNQDDKESWLQTAKGIWDSEWKECDIIFINVNQGKENSIPLSIGNLGMAKQDLDIILGEKQEIQKVETKMGRAISQSDRSAGLTEEEKACAHWLYIWLVKELLNKKIPSREQIDLQMSFFQSKLEKAKEEGRSEKFLKSIMSDFRAKKEDLKEQTDLKRKIPKEIPDEIYRFVRPNVARLFLKVYDPFSVQKAYQMRKWKYPEAIDGLYGYYLVPPLNTDISKPIKRFQVNKDVMQ